MLVNKLVCSKSDVLSHMTEENTPASNRITNCIRIISSGTKPTNYTLFLREVGPGRARLDSDMKICGSPSMTGTRHSNTYHVSKPQILDTDYHVRQSSLFYSYPNAVTHWALH